MIIGGGASVLVLASAGVGTWAAIHPDATKAPTAAPAKKPVLDRYRSTSLTIPRTTVWKSATATAAGLLFVEPQVAGFNGLIMDDDGEPVWIEPTKANLTDLRVQHYLGAPVITYWSGKSIGGHGQGEGSILDTGYNKIAEVKAGNGLLADLHEFTVTSRGTALMTAYSTVRADLSSIGGPSSGYMFNCHVQEVDIATGTVLLDWDAMQHVPIDETYLTIKLAAGADGSTPAKAFDTYHANAISEDGDALLVSLRHTHTVYCIDRTTGTVRWRFGGKNGDIAIADDAKFAWQHDVRMNPNGQVSLFDNHYYSPGSGHSRGMFFEVDATKMVATNTAEFAYQNHRATAMGSVQLLEGGHVLVGWGVAPFVTEFAPDGQAIYQASLGGISYRANRAEWHSSPTTVPDIAVAERSGKLRVHASWNGATEVASWRVLQGPNAGSLAPVVTVKRAGFETSILAPSAAQTSVEALDQSGKILGRSRAIAA
jgi:hypothetical protein